MTYDTAHLGSPGQCDPPAPLEYLNIKICKPDGTVVYSGIVDSNAVIYGEEVNQPRTAAVTLPLVDFPLLLEVAAKPKEAE